MEHLIEKLMVAGQLICFIIIIYAGYLKLKRDAEWRKKETCKCGRRIVCDDD